MCKTIYALLILIFIFIVLNWLKTRETFSSNCKYDLSNKPPDFTFEVIKSYHDKILQDVKAECSRDPSCKYFDYIETKSAADGLPSKGMGAYRKCTKGLEDKSYIKINKIKISLNKKEYLQLGEVEVIGKDGKTNLIRGINDVVGTKSSIGMAEQSSTHNSKSPEAHKAVNGNKSGVYEDGIACTSNRENPSWTFTWKNPIKLSDISKIIIYNRTDSNQERINGAKVELLMDSKVIKIFPLLNYVVGKNVYDFLSDNTLDSSALSAITQYKKVCDTPKSNSNIFSDGLLRTNPVQREPKQANNMFGAVFNVRQGKSFLSSKLN